jgi:hypothetical protein
MEQAVSMLRQLPDSRHVLARSLFYLSCFQTKQHNASAGGEGNLEEALSLYRRHLGVSEAKSLDGLGTMDFDSLLVHYLR